MQCILNTTALSRIYGSDAAGEKKVRISNYGLFVALSQYDNLAQGPVYIKNECSGLHMSFSSNFLGLGLI
eukprot:snap_masked-scaffold_2-processed-gene-5.9-mRNA-1 protein AED:1.00 eAED:1.00 QI:0/0/0/0/1/1/3/0/69